MTAALAACGSSDSGGDASGTSTSTAVTAAAAADPLGKGDVAKGDPIKLGAINFELNPTASFPQMRVGAEAAVKYVNQHLGGVGGRPLSLDVCLTDGSPAKSTACANKIIQAKPAAVLGLSDIAGAQTLPLYEKAGLAQIGGGDFTPAEASAENSIIFNDLVLAGTADIGAFAVQDLKAKKVAILYLDDPQVKQSVQWTVDAIKGSGGEAKLFPFPATQADSTATVSAALDDDPDAIVINAQAQCVSLLQSLKNLGNTKPVIGIEPCASPPVLKAAGPAADGMYFFRVNRPVDGDEEQATIFRAAMDAYAPKDTPQDSLAVAGFGGLMNLYDQIKDEDPATLDSQQILSKIKQGRTQKSWLSPDYVCDGTAFPGFPSVCSTAQYLYQVKDGEAVLSSNEPYDKGPQFLGGGH